MPALVFQGPESKSHMLVRKWKLGPIQSDPRSSQGDSPWLYFHGLKCLVTGRHPLTQGGFGTDPSPQLSAALECKNFSLLTS